MSKRPFNKVIHKIVRSEESKRIRTQISPRKTKKTIMNNRILLILKSANRSFPNCPKKEYKSEIMIQLKKKNRKNPPPKYR